MKTLLLGLLILAYDDRLFRAEEREERQEQREELQEQRDWEQMRRDEQAMEEEDFHERLIERLDKLNGDDN